MILDAGFAGLDTVLPIWRPGGHHGEEYVESGATVGGVLPLDELRCERRSVVKYRS
jgi:hypothetical protein